MPLRLPPLLFLLGLCGAGNMSNRKQGRGDELAGPEGEGWELVGVSPHGRPEGPTPQLPAEPSLPATLEEILAWVSDNQELLSATGSCKMARAILSEGALVCAAAGWPDLAALFEQRAAELSTTSQYDHRRVEDLLRRMRQKAEGMTQMTHALDNPAPAQVEPRNEEERIFFMLASIYSGGVTDVRLRDVCKLAMDPSLTVEQKLAKIDGLLPFPSTTKAAKLGELLGVSKQAILKTQWWRGRRAEADEAAHDAESRLRERGKRWGA
jgi:hypothetical protein